MTTITDPITIKNLQLAHRLALAPMTRSRALTDGTPGPLAAQYYAQRADLGLLITEGTQPSDDGQGYLNTPGIYRPEHIAGWRQITDAVHERGGRVFIQLMHVGRMSHPANTPHHRPALAPSAIAPGVTIFTPSGAQPVPTPRALTIAEIATTVADFRRAAAAAIAAGADGIELHGGNGYLLQQFLAPNANTRTDRYGGSIANRARLMLEIAAAVADEIGAERVGIRLSPGGRLGGLDEGLDAADLYRHLVGGLAALDLAYLHLLHVSADEQLLADLRRAWPNTLLLLRAGRTVDRDALDAELAAGIADVLPLGSSALANPDILARLRAGARLNVADPSTFYGGGAAGYTDYPTLDVLQPV
ncbi:alkene reductase [Microbacterium kribbense]|uniref:Alkene reductase n=1 Tax=Microbacterium kribbense TaxID=433645 RepID=A0ABP7GGB7_9MICO